MLIFSIKLFEKCKNDQRFEKWNIRNEKVKIFINITNYTESLKAI